MTNAPTAHAAPLHLLVITDTPLLAAGGSERFLRNLLPRLDVARYRIHVVQLCAEPLPHERVQAPLDLPHVRLRYLPVGAVYGRRGIRALAALRRIVRDEHIDVVQTQHEKSDILSALLSSAGKPLRRISNRRDMGFAKSARVRVLFRCINSRFDRIVAPANAILCDVADNEGADRACMRWIPNGVDAQRFRPPSADERHLRRRELGYADDVIVIGCVASLVPVKRHVDLIAAFAHLHARVPAARLLLVGDGPLRADMEQQIASLSLDDAVQLLGDRGGVEHFLQAMDAFVLASSTEGMSNAIIEAMACGLAIVATRVGGNVDLVEDGINGWVVPPHDVTALSVALQALADDPQRRARYGAAGRERVVERFSLERMVESFESLYRELAP